MRFKCLFGMKGSRQPDRKENKKKQRRDGMSRLGSSRNVQWSEGGTTKWLYPRGQNLVNISSFISGYFDELKRWIKKFFRKMKQRIFGRNPKASYFMTEHLIVQKASYILVSLCEFLYLFRFWEKSTTIWKKNLEKRENFLHHFLSSKNPERKKSTSLLAYISLVKLTKPWTPYLVSVLRYRNSSLKEPSKFFLITSIFGRKTKALYSMKKI